MKDVLGVCECAASSAWPALCYALHLLYRSDRLELRIWHAFFTRIVNFYQLWKVQRARRARNRHTPLKGMFLLSITIQIKLWGCRRVFAKITDTLLVLYKGFLQTLWSRFESFGCLLIIVAKWQRILWRLRTESTRGRGKADHAAYHTLSSLDKTVPTATRVKLLAKHSNSVKHWGRSRKHMPMEELTVEGLVR